MKTKKENIQVRLINPREFKETHGLFVDNQLQHLGTESECTFLLLKLQSEIENHKLKLMNAN